MVIYSTDRSKAVVPVLVLLSVALWFLLRGDFFFMSYLVLFCSLCFSVLLALRLPHLGKRELILVFFYMFVWFLLVFVLSVSSSSWCLGRAAVCDCGIPWTFLLPFCLMRRLFCYYLFLISASCGPSGLWHFLCTYILCTVCLDLFALPLGVIGRFCFVSVAIPGHI